MEAPSKSENPARPRRRRRWLIFLTILALAVASYWVVPWLLMPEDLRRMQGAWKVVKYTDGGKEVRPEGPDRMQIVGNLFCADNDERYQIRMKPEEKRIYFYDAAAHEYELLGFKIRLPFALARPSECVCVDYQLTDRQLVLCVTGVMDVATGQVTERPDEQHKIYLERP